MKKSSNPPDATSKDAPLNQFSQCHVGIMSHLQAFDGLPALAESAALARRIATETLAFFRDVIVAHHAEEEQELFPAVLASALAGEERDHASQIVTRLTREHREIESAWTRFEPALKNLASGRDATFDANDVHTLVERYRAHATYEEQEFLPLSQTILMRDSKHMSALGLSLHTRHALPEVLARFSRRF